MAASVVACLVLIFLPLSLCFSNNCTHTLPCNPPLQIMPPFYFQDDIAVPSCQSFLLVGCDKSNNRSILVWHDLSLPLESISYNANIIHVQDPYLGNSLDNSGCANLYFNFNTPVTNFYYEMYERWNLSLFSMRCQPSNQIQSPPAGVFGVEYNLSFSPLPDPNDVLLPAQENCRSPHDSPPSFEYFLSFENENGEFSLLSASYSSYLRAQPGCFAHSMEVFGGHHGKGPKASILAELSGSLGGVLLLVIALLIFLKLQRNCNARKKFEKLFEQYESVAPRRYEYSELKKITHSFQYKLGKGGFGTVYKGTQPDGRIVAVKILHASTGNGEEFLNEVVSIGRTSHVNVVSLLGFCIKGSKRALIYEYMPNKSLDAYIYSENPKTVLGWEKLYGIALGVARGLEYLHRGCSTHIVHFDIKPQNILLDESFCPKIADFGLAKLCPPKQSIISSLDDMRGTIGYIAPEVFSRGFGVVSTKSDVYSYGMMVLEMVGGRKNTKPSAGNPSEVFFPHWVYDRVANGGDITGCEVTNETDELARKMALVGIWCTQTIPANRPSMSRVVEMLERNLSELELPPKPCLWS